MGLPPQTLGGALRCLTRFRLRLQLKQRCAASKTVPFYIIPTPYAQCGGRKSACSASFFLSFWFSTSSRVFSSCFFLFIALFIRAVDYANRGFEGCYSPIFRVNLPFPEFVLLFFRLFSYFPSYSPVNLYLENYLNHGRIDLNPPIK